MTKFLSHTDDKQLIDQTLLTDMQQNASVQEKQMWATKGATQNSDGIFQVNEKPVLSKSLSKQQQL